MNPLHLAVWELALIPAQLLLEAGFTRDSRGSLSNADGRKRKFKEDCKGLTAANLCAQLAGSDFFARESETTARRGAQDQRALLDVITFMVLQGA